MSKQWSYSNCYLFFNKSFGSQIEAEEFCQTAFGEKYIGELGYGIGLGPVIVARINVHGYHHNQTIPKWKYQKLGILDIMDDFICRCNTSNMEYIGYKKHNECPLHEKNSCPSTVYSIPTVCAISSKISEKE